MQENEVKTKLSLNIKIFIIFACIFFAFTMYTSGYRPLPAWQQRTTHLTLALIMIFLTKPITKKSKNIFNPVNIIILIATILSGGYMIINYESIVYRLGITTTPDIIMGLIMIVLVMEATRRCMGLALPIIALLALLYGFFGNLLPRSIAHGGYSFTRIASHLSLTTEGIFGIPLGASATVVAIFIAFAAMLSGIGAGQYFVDISMTKFGKAKGGSAKAAVVGSGLMGMLTGSVIATVMGIGTFTTPLMKENKYDPITSASITAVASTGGQIMPPVMGAAAYIIAETLRLPVIEVIKAAFVPAVLFYFAIYCYVDIEAKKNKRESIDDDKLQEYKKKTKGKHYLIIPIIALVILMVVMNTLPVRAAFYGTVFAFLVGVIQKTNRLNIKKLIDIAVSTAKGCLEVASATACAGIIIGILSLTGLGLQLSSLIISLAGDSLMLLLFITMVISLILGMGMTTTACYIILAVLVAPSLVDMGVLPIAAHFFVFFFGMYSFITPPVALGAYASASLTGANPFKTGIKAFQIAIPSFIIPYFFAFDSSLLLIGSIKNIILVVLGGLVGSFLIATSTVGYFRRNLVIWERVLIFIAGICLIIPEGITDVIGLVFSVLLLGKIYYSTKNTQDVVTSTE